MTGLISVALVAFPWLLAAVTIWREERAGGGDTGER